MGEALECPFGNSRFTDTDKGGRPVRRYIACLLTLGATSAFTQQLNAQITLPARSENQSQVVQQTSLRQAAAEPAMAESRVQRPAAPNATSAAAPTLRKLSVPSEQVRSIATALSLRYRDVEGVRISPDARNHHLVVMAPEKAQQQIAQDVQKFLAAGGVRKIASGVPGPVEYQLHHLSSLVFEQLIRQMEGRETPVTTSQNGRSASYQLTTAPMNGTTITVDRDRRIVTIDGPRATKASWQTLMELVDEKQSRAGELIRIMRLGHTEPAPIQRAVRLLRDLQPLNRQAMPASQDSRTQNAIFRTAAFQQDAAQAPDAGTPPAGDAPAGGQDQLAGGIGDAQIQFVPELGQIIIKGTQQEIDQIKGVIEEIQKASELTSPDVEVLRLKHADCNAVAALLQQLYEDVLSARQGEVSITSLDSPNALLLIGRTEALKSLRDLISKIDLPVEPSSRLRVFRLQNASAADAEAVIRDFIAEGSEDDARPGLGLRIRIFSDYRTNSLIVNASPRDMTEITRLINDLDVQSTEATNEIKVFPIRNADASELATTLQEAVIGDGDAGNDNLTAPSTALSIVAVDGKANEIVASGILSGASITADTGANAIVVRAKSTNMSLIAELIRQLDKSPGIDSLVKVFQIEYGDATQLATALSTLFGDEATTSGTTIGAANVAGLPSVSASADSTLVPLRFSPEARTNSIVASGSASDLEVVESILLRLDSEGFAERITEVIWLRHSVADNVAAAITNYVNERSQSQTNITQYQQGLGPYDLVDRDLIVVPEADSNSLLMSVSPRLYEDVRRLIDRLDRRRPMVLIKVLMAEVSLGDTFEIGGELGLQDSLVFNRGLAVADAPGTVTPGDSGFNFNNAGVVNRNSSARDTLAATGVSSFGLGTTSQLTNYGGFVLNAASESVSLLMRTLHEANRLQVLSRPQVMTMDGTESLVSIGSKVARVTGINITNNASQTETTDIDVGLILRVTPRVGADGLITMNIDATRSSRDPNNGTAIVDGNGNVVVIDDILQTVAQSTLTAYSGQTVVFGGLIQKTRTNVSRRVPVVADIPIIGNMFKYDIEQEDRSELLVVMTPMLINGGEDLDYVKQTESSRMSWCLADVVEAHGDVGLSGGYGLWGPAVGNTIYPDLTPTVQREQIVSDHPQHAPVQQVVPQGVQQQVIPQQSIPQQPLQNNGIYEAQPATSAPVPQVDALPSELPAPIQTPLPGPAQSMKSRSSGAAPASSVSRAEYGSVKSSPISVKDVRKPVDTMRGSTSIAETPVVDPFDAGLSAPRLKDNASTTPMTRKELAPKRLGQVQTAAVSADTPTASTIPVSWLSTASENVNRVSNASALPSRLGNALQSQPQSSSATTNASQSDAPASKDDSSVLLPAISPRAWIR